MQLTVIMKYCYIFGANVAPVAQQDRATDF